MLVVACVLVIGVVVSVAVNELFRDEEREMSEHFGVAREEDEMAS